MLSCPRLALHIDQDMACVQSMGSHPALGLRPDLINICAEVGLFRLNVEGHNV